jgi:hypothetical protein
MKKTIRSIIVICVVVLVAACGDDVVSTLADAAVMLRDASAETDARAQPPTEPTEITLTCDQSGTETLTSSKGEPNESAIAILRTWAKVSVDEPRSWLVERCGRHYFVDDVEVLGNSSCANPNVTCEGTPAPGSDCALELPHFTGTEVTVICSTDTTTSTQHQVTSYDSVRLVQR